MTVFRLAAVRIERYMEAVHVNNGIKRLIRYGSIYILCINSVSVFISPIHKLVAVGIDFGKRSILGIICNLHCHARIYNAVYVEIYIVFNRRPMCRKYLLINRTNRHILRYHVSVCIKPAYKIISLPCNFRQCLVKLIARKIHIVNVALAAVMIKYYVINYCNPMCFESCVARNLYYALRRNFNSVQIPAVKYISRSLSLGKCSVCRIICYYHRRNNEL